ncbi:MAG: CD225/dispanin family protein [Prevotellaceae bacterium]|jgi:hypothetical protein|nr:CD225/dispanin family protein [Prevotellaceae bacterium]
MKKYFYSDGSNSFGPFTLEELKEQSINRETPVWFQGLSEWKKAGDIAELNEIFKFVPPTITKPNLYSKKMENNTQNQFPPKTWLLESILTTLLCCLPFGIVGIVNAAKVESRFYAGDIEGAERYSREAKKWTLVSFWIGLGVFVIYLILIVIGVIPIIGGRPGYW